MQIMIFVGPWCSFANLVIITLLNSPDSIHEGKGRERVVVKLVAGKGDGINGGER